MANLEVQLKDGIHNLFPKTTMNMVDGLSPILEEFYYRWGFKVVDSSWTWDNIVSLFGNNTIPAYHYSNGGHDYLLWLADAMEGDAYKFSAVYAGAEYMVTLSQNDGWSGVSILNLAEVFPVEYGVTSFQDIVNAINNHMLPVLNVTENANTVSVYNLYNIYHSSGEISAVWFRKGIYEIGVIFDGLSATTYTPLPGELIRENLFWVENNGDHTGTALQDIYEAISNDMFIICQVDSRMFYVSDSDLDIPSMRFSSFDGKYFDISVDPDTGDTYYSDFQEKVSPITFLNGSETVSEITDIIMSGSIPVYLDISSGKCYYGTELNLTTYAITMRCGDYIFTIEVDPNSGDTIWGNPTLANVLNVTLTLNSMVSATADKTVQEIYDAFTAGKTVRIYVNIGKDTYLNVSIAQYDESTQEYTIQAFAMEEPSGALTVIYAAWQNSSGTSWTLTQHQLS